MINQIPSSAPAVITCATPIAAGATEQNIMNGNHVSLRIREACQA